ncbi:MAG: glycosyltransferase [Thermofilaceae archaeon]
MNSTLCNKEALVSIIIPNINGEKILPLCLDSLLNQSFKNFEVIVIDNRSRDSSYRICEEYKLKGLKISFVKLNRNYGYSAAITLGAILSKSKYILATNNDIIFDKSFLEIIINKIENIRKIRSNIVAASPVIYHFPDTNTIFYAGGVLSFISGHYMYYNRDVSQVVRELKGIKYTFFPSGAAALIDREIFVKMGGYDPIYFAGVEEMDFGLQLYRNGFKAVIITDAKVFHLESATFGSRSLIHNYHKLFLSLRNLLIYYFKNYDAIRLVIAFISHIIISTTLIIYSILKRDPNIVAAVRKAYTFFIRNDLKRIKKRRSRIINKNYKMTKILKLAKHYGIYIELKYIFPTIIKRYFFYV